VLRIVRVLTEHVQHGLQGADVDLQQVLYE
jgi:hypothetical protein